MGTLSRTGLPETPTRLNLQGGPGTVALAHDQWATLANAVPSRARWRYREPVGYVSCYGI